MIRAGLGIVREEVAKRVDFRELANSPIVRTAVGLYAAILTLANGMYYGQLAFQEALKNINQYLHETGIVREIDGQSVLYLDLFSINQEEATPVPANTQEPETTLIPTPYSTPTDYYSLIRETWPDVDPNQVYSVAQRESGLIPNIVRVNYDDGTYFTELITSSKRFYELLEGNGVESVDIGFMQINTGSIAVNRYLTQKGYTWYDLLDPEKNLEVAHDLYSGKIPLTGSGWCHWHTAVGLYVNADDCK